MNHSILIGEENIPIVIRKHPRSRRMVIRYQPLKQQVSLTLPRYVSIRQGLRFVEEKRAWIERQLHEEARPVPFSDGQIIPVQGKDYILTHRAGRGLVTIDSDRIIVPGEVDFLARRVREWLKRRAREEIVPLAEQKAAAIGKRLKKISLRDTSSRWGSCSHDGNLSFSWRLILAPAGVLDYLVCHEVAHLAEHNHSTAFWAIVERLCPTYESAQKWLKTHGQRLYAYG